MCTQIFQATNSGYLLQQEHSTNLQVTTDILWENHVDPAFKASKYSTYPENKRFILRHRQIPNKLKKDKEQR